MSGNFKELRAAMSPESQERSRLRAQVMLDDLASGHAKADSLEATAPEPASGEATGAGEASRGEQQQ